MDRDGRVLRGALVSGREKVRAGLEIAGAACYVGAWALLAAMIVMWS